MRRRLASAAATLLLGLALPPAAAHGELEFAPGGIEAETLNASNAAETRAGAHPDRLVVRFAFATTASGEVEGNPKEIAIDFPPGLVGNPQATPTCRRLLFAQGFCPPESQVGTVTQTLSLFGQDTSPLYNVEPTPGELAEFGFSAFFLPARFLVGLRDDGSFGIRLRSPNIPQEVPPLDNETVLWGVPADHQSGTGIPRRALLTIPTRCGAKPEPMTFRMRTWQDPDELVSASIPTDPPIGCENLPFAPELAIAASHSGGDAPTGIGVELTLPQNDDPDGLATSHIRAASVTLPAGFSLSPGVMHGLSVCTDAQLGSGNDPGDCPQSAKIGATELVNPALLGTLRGDIYLGEPEPADPFRIFLTANGPGFTVKLRGSLRTDPATGRVTAVLPNLPEIPFSRIALRFKDGARAPLASPPGCGAGAATATLTPYSGGTDSVVSASVTDGGGTSACRPGAPFSPAFSAGVSPPYAATSSAFSATIGRRDGEQTLAGIEIALPPGLAANLTAVAPCPEASAIAASCPASSRVGSTIAEAGAGPAPFPVGGEIYLTGPYGGAPFGLALVLRAKVGPFDLGTSVIRATLAADPADGRLTVATDPLPQILAGIPLRLRTLGIDIDRPGFMVNPTSCRPARTGAKIESADGATAWPTVPFGISGCRRLGFEPRISVLVGGRDPRHPGLRIRLRPSAGDANVRSFAVKLPQLLELNDEAAIAPCSRREFRGGECLASRVGTVQAETPLLSAPLSGAAYLVQATDVGAPEIWTSLQGGGVRLDARSVLAIAPGGQLRTTVVALPDLPLTAFTIRVDGGRGSLIASTVGGCEDGGERRLLAAATLRAHNGIRLKRLLRVRVRPSCRAASERGRG